MTKTKKNSLIIDGSIHIYEEEKYRTRLSLRLKELYKEYDKAKIFLVDSALEMGQTELLIANFLRWNDLVPEYFCGGGR